MLPSVALGVICCRTWPSESQGWEFVAFVPSEGPNALVDKAGCVSSRYATILVGGAAAVPPLFHESPLATTLAGIGVWNSLARNRVLDIGRRLTPLLEQTASA